jgi:anti-anti-sigma regulatory factor
LTPTSLSTIDRVVIATLTRDLTSAVVQRLRDDLLARVHEVRARGVVFDVASLYLMDPWEFRALQQTAAMVRLLGARVVLAGLPPQVVEALAALDVDTAGFDATVATVHDALQALGR